MGVLIEAWDKQTGKKLPHFVPAHWFDCGLADHLSKTPVDAGGTPVKKKFSKDKGESENA